MQRVVSIHLNGNTYQLEEAGYNSLFAYLDARETQLQDDPERAQKMADLEREVAEKIQGCLTPTKTIVTSAEIERIIGEFGPFPPSIPTGRRHSRRRVRRDRHRAGPPADRRSRIGVSIRFATAR